MLHQIVEEITVRTNGRGFYEVTNELATQIAKADMMTGLLTLHLQHTSASLVIQENADPEVTGDLNDFFGRLVPDDPRLYRHTVEGPDDMPAHIRLALTATQVGVPVMNGRMALGTWQGIYVFEHRRSPHKRAVAAHLLGE